MKHKLKLTLFLCAALSIVGCSKHILSDNEFSEKLSDATRMAKNSNQIKVATYNLHLFLGPHPFEDKQRQNEIVIYMRRNMQHTDIVFLSEIWKDDVKNEMVETLKDIYPYSIHSNSKKLSIGDGLLILSKFPIKESAFIVFKDAEGVEWFAPKGFHKTLFSAPTGDFYAFFTHVQADSDKHRTRKKQFEQIKTHIRETEGVPSIIVGDLNVAGDFSEEYHNNLKTIFDEYMDSYRVANPDLNTHQGYTYDNTTMALADYFYPQKTNGECRERLDYILSSKDWKIVSSRIINDANYYSSYFKRSVSVSDHYGVETALALEKEVRIEDPRIADSYEEAIRKINGLKDRFGAGLAAKIIIGNNTDKDLVFKNQTAWYNSTFFSPIPSAIPPGKYGVVLATHNAGEASGVFNQLSYTIDGYLVSFGTYAPWALSYTNNVWVNFSEITQNDLETLSTRPSIEKNNGVLKLTGKITGGYNALVEFTVS